MIMRTRRIFPLRTSRSFLSPHVGLNCVCEFLDSKTFHMFMTMLIFLFLLGMMVMISSWMLVLVFFLVMMMVIGLSTFWFVHNSCLPYTISIHFRRVWRLHTIIFSILFKFGVFINFWHIDTFEIILLSWVPQFWKRIKIKLSKFHRIRFHFPVFHLLIK